jgi:hypothetical protein
MATAEVAALEPPRAGAEPVERGLRAGVLGLVASVVIGVASTAPGAGVRVTRGCGGRTEWPRWRSLTCLEL